MVAICITNMCMIIVIWMTIMGTVGMFMTVICTTLRVVTIGIVTVPIRTFRMRLMTIAMIMHMLGIVILFTVIEATLTFTVHHFYTVLIIHVRQKRNNCHCACILSTVGEGSDQARAPETYSASSTFVLPQESLALLYPHQLANNR
jgi:hypothetical protein